MKKSIITLGIILGMTMTSFADGGLFHRGNNGQNSQNSGYVYYDAMGGEKAGDPGTPLLPPHGSQNNENAPLGSGIALLTVLGAGYVVAKKRREE